jgi:exonuclease III
LGDGLITRPRKKTPITKEKEEKMGQINTMKTNSKRKKDLRLATWNVRSLYRTGGLRITINELRKYKIAIAAIQETRWNKFTPQAFTSNGYNIYTSSLANNHGFGTAFLVDSKFNHLVINFTPINERLCVIRIKGRFFNYSLINIHAPTNDSEEEAKDQFYEQLERAYAACPSHDVKLVMGDANAKVGRQTSIQTTC